MKHNKSRRAKKVTDSPSANLNETSAGAKSFVPSSDEVAREAYFSDANEDSFPGQNVQHLLKEESKEITRRNRTRTHGYHNQT